MIKSFLRITFLFLLVAYLFSEMDMSTTSALAGDNRVLIVASEFSDISPAASEEGVEDAEGEDYSVQAVLSSGKSVVISAPIDGDIIDVVFESGDKFKKGDVLARYDCSAEKAKVREIKAKLSVSNRQLEAYKRLKDMDVVSDVEYVSVVGSNRQDKEVLNQAATRLKMCTIKAPFDGRIQDKMVGDHEVVKAGRILMKISSSEPLNVELMTPSIWLRWLNVGAPVDVYIRESGKTYRAEIIRIHGEVDPVSQSIHLVAKIEGYNEELLPGMSGKAMFKNSSKRIADGFMGLKTEL